jgi:hypothetical protein
MIKLYETDDEVTASYSSDERPTIPMLAIGAVVADLTVEEVLAIDADWEASQ